MSLLKIATTTLLMGAVTTAMATPLDYAAMFSNAKHAMKQSDIKTLSITLAPAIAKKSGLANLYLAEAYEKKNRAGDSIQFALNAARFGYPAKGYQIIADIYKTGLGKVKQNYALNACYQNLVKAYPNQAFLNHCIAESVGNFTIMPNDGVQNDYEASLKAKRDYNALCHGISQSLFNPRVDSKTIAEIRKLACQDQSRKNNFQAGEMVMIDHKLYQVGKNQSLLPFDSTLNVGTLVHVKQKPYQTYLYNGKALEVPKKNTTVSINNTLYYYVDGKLTTKRNNQP